VAQEALVAVFLDLPFPPSYQEAQLVTGVHHVHGVQLVPGVHHVHGVQLVPGVWLVPVIQLVPGVQLVPGSGWSLELLQ